ncbi:hypothetical protein H8356DRAFT_1633678 [Neocallimastix lanati (nom. inval.)]|nr:hypothetical protein H8356DRAFT_1633678 [Neocallimastix sp. JGI-2020a]
MKINTLTPPSSIEKDHHGSEKLYKKAYLNEINSLTDSMDHSPITKQKYVSKSKIEQDQMMKSSSSKLKNKIGGYYNPDEKLEVQTSFRSPKTISKTNSPIIHRNSLSNSLSLHNKVKNISPTPSPISARSQSSSQLLANNILKGHSRSPSNLSCNTSRTRYYSIQLPKESNKSDAYHGSGNVDEMAYKKNDQRYDMEVNDNILAASHSHLQNLTHHRSQSQSLHNKKEKEISNRKSPSTPSKSQKFFAEDKMNINNDYMIKNLYELKYINLALEKSKNQKYKINSIKVLPKKTTSTNYTSIGN